MPSYAIGDKAPALHPDAGSGPWCSAPKTMQYGLLKQMIELAMETDKIQLQVGPEAVAQMHHFLDNTGTDYIVDVEQMMTRSDYLRQRHDEELAEAKAFAETLQPGTYSITSTRVHGGYFRRSHDPRYYFAIGGFTYWGQGRVVVKDAGRGGRSYALDFEFHFYDRYNWDNGKKTEVAGVSVKDAYLQELHRHCYAREYDVKGESKRQVTWEKVSDASRKDRRRNPLAALMN